MIGIFENSCQSTQRRFKLCMKFKTEAQRLEHRDKTGNIEPSRNGRKWRLSTKSNRSQDFKNAMKMACNAEDCGFQMLNDDEIVTSVQEESGPVDDETDEDEGSNNNNESN
ncbi:hypothetical protein TNCV_1475381 [Trichonephila clavipes]|nr:hypothetical protein TNCV_1475381 [Trichonephila clavipes]